MVGRPAARITDMHVCPMTPIPPGLPIIPPTSFNTIIGGLPAARMTDRCLCVGPPPANVDVIITGSMGVLINNLPAARIADLTVKGGMITTGCFTVLIGEIAAGAPSAPGFGLPGFPGLPNSISDFIGDWITNPLLDALGVPDQISIAFPESWENGILGLDWFKVLALKGKVEFKREGMIGTFKAGGAFDLVKMNVVFQDPVYNYYGVNWRAGYGNADGEIVYSGQSITDAEVGVKGQFITAQGAATGFTGDPNNPFYEAGIETKGAALAGELRAAVGDGGTQDGGLSVTGKGAADLANAAIVGEHTDFNDDGTTSTYRARVSGGLGAGASGGGHGVYDEGEDRSHVGGEASGKFIGGMGLEGDYSEGEPYSSRDRSYIN